MTKAQIAGLEDSFNWFSYIVELHKDEREKKRVVFVGWQDWKYP